MKYFDVQIEARLSEPALTAQAHDVVVGHHHLVNGGEAFTASFLVVSMYLPIVSFSPFLDFSCRNTSKFYIKFTLSLFQSIVGSSAV